LPAWLSRTMGVDFYFDTPVLAVEGPRLRTAAGAFSARRVAICTGADFRDLAPEAFAASGMVPCKLQMMRTPAYPRFRLGTMLAAGLTLRHYKAFAACPTLPALARRLDETMPEYGQYGVHVMAAQNGRGEIILGDTHEYGDAVEPFDKPHLDELVLAYLRTFTDIPDLSVAARWHGVYVKHPTEPVVTARPDPGVVAVTGVGGAGMTLSFGLAERTAEGWD
ncbi:MAG: FAD-dependent oxidoreductase, partial [Gemmataceae bacterium]